MTLPVNELLASPKEVHHWTGLHARSNHIGHLVGVGDLVDAQGATIAGVTLQIEVKAPIVTDRCLFIFSLMQLNQKRRIPVYRLEVAPLTKRTHNGTIPIYGPHEHVDGEEPTEVRHAGVSCEHWDESLRWFFARAGIVPFEIEDPHRHVEL